MKPESHISIQRDHLGDIAEWIGQLDGDRTKLLVVVREFMAEAKTATPAFEKAESLIREMAAR